MKNYTGITDKEKLHLLRQQLATQDRVIVELRKKRMSAVCRAKAFQKHLKDAKGRVNEFGAQAQYFESLYRGNRQAYVAETAAHVKTARQVDHWKALYEAFKGETHSTLVQKNIQIQDEVERGDKWCIAAYISWLCLIGGAIGVYVGLRG